MPATSEAVLVTFRGGFVADWAVVERLLVLETRGARFELKSNGGFRVVPPSVLTPDDTAFLRARRDDARRVLEYQADDSHLFTDTGVSPSLPARAMPPQKPHRSKQDYGTPAVFIRAVLQRLGIGAFAFDFAATAANTKASRYWSVDDDALAQPASRWAARVGAGWGWLNPPYTDIGPWAQKCRQMAEAGGQMAFLVPASVGSNWYRDHVEGHAHVLFLNGRLAFIPDKPQWLYPKDCLLALYSPFLPRTSETWDWRRGLGRTDTQGLVGTI